MATMQDIERETRQYAEAKRRLNEVMAEFRKEADELKASFAADIRKAMGRVTSQHADLYREIAENRDLFGKPRTQEFDGIVVGLKKGRGKLEITDEDQTIAVIEEDFPKLAKLLIRTEKTLVKDAVKKLPPETLEAIGAAITGKEDRIIIEDVDSQIDRVMSSILKFQVEDLGRDRSTEMGCRYSDSTRQV
jgi:hypothetical protein